MTAGTALDRLRAEAAAEERFGRLVSRFHRLGDRALLQFLDELAAERMLRTAIERRLLDYVDRLDPKTLRDLEAHEAAPDAAAPGRRRERRASPGSRTKRDPALGELVRGRG
jgi:hypothetical protein